MPFQCCSSSLSPGVTSATQHKQKFLHPCPRDDLKGLRVATSRLSAQDLHSHHRLTTGLSANGGTLHQLPYPVGCQTYRQGRASRAFRITAKADNGEGSDDSNDQAPAGIRPPSIQERLALLELYTSSDDEGDLSQPSATRRLSAFTAKASSTSVTQGTADADGAGNAASPPMTVADRLAKQVKVVVNDEVVVPIGIRKKLVRKNVKPVTEAQQRNLRRSIYLENVGQRNDSTFFFIVAASIMLPPIIILSVAFSSGYLEFPF